MAVPTEVTHPDMVARGNDARPGTSGFAGYREGIISAQSPKRKTPTSPGPVPTDVTLIREHLQNRGPFSRVTNIMEDQGPESYMKAPYQNGSYTVVKGKFIH